MMTAAQARAVRLFGEKMGRAIVAMMVNRYLAFLWFYLACFMLAVFVAPLIGLVGSWGQWDDWPLWYKLSASYGPIPVMIVFRKRIPGIWLVIFLAGLAAGALSLVVSLFV